MLDIDINATSIALLLPEGHQEGSLRPAVLEAVAATLGDLQGRRAEVAAMDEQVLGLYDRLAVVQEERIHLGAGLDEIRRSDAMETVAEELARLGRWLTLHCIVARALEEGQVEVEQEAMEYLVTVADGDARSALTNVQVVVETAWEEGVARVGLGKVREVVQRATNTYDKTGDEH